MAKRLRQEFTTQMLGGVDRNVNTTKLPFGERVSFTALTNLVPDSRYSLKRINGVELAVDTGGGPIKALHLFRRIGAADMLLAIVTRPGDTDALCFRSGSAWVPINALPATNGYYNLVQWRDKVFILDGLNTPRFYNGISISLLIGSNIPVNPSCGVIHQERLFLAGGTGNPDRVWFSDVIDETTFQAGSFYNFLVGKNGSITALAINSLTTSNAGAQSQLAIFKATATGIINGVVGSGTELLSVLSGQVGCPASHTIVNTNHGLVFMGTNTVLLLDLEGGEPKSIGYKLGHSIRDIPTALKSQAVATMDASDDGPFYRISIPPPTGGNNSIEWMLGLHETTFTDLLWYGPHSGDTIHSYVIQDTVVYAGEPSTGNLWMLNSANQVGSMTDPINARTVSMEWPTILLPDYRAQLIDAVGVVATVEPEHELKFTISSGGESTLFTQAGMPESGSLVWDINNWDEEDWAGNQFQTVVVRPRLRGVECQTTLEYTVPDELTIHNLYVRVKPTGRSTETVR